MKDDIGCRYEYALHVNLCLSTRVYGEVMKVPACVTCRHQRMIEFKIFFWLTSGSKKGSCLTYTESRPSVSKTNRPNPKPPSLGWPLSLTPQPLTQVIQLRTISSSLFTTKSKKLLPMAEVVETRRSLEQYIMGQFMLNRSRIKAVRKDLLERWSKVMGVSRVECRLSGSGDTLLLRSEEADRLFGLSESRGLELLQDEDADGDGDAGRAMADGIGLFGIGDGSPHR